MKILFLCKASSKIGLGHLIRSRSLATQILQQAPNIQLEFKVIGEPLVKRLLFDVAFNYEIYANEESCVIEGRYTVCFFDMIKASNSFFETASSQADLTVSLSPVFDKMSRVDILINRTRYHNLKEDDLPKHIFASLDYAIIQENCKNIRTSAYEDNLELQHFPIAISMGGGDAANKTLSVLRSLKKCPVPATFWVMLGEGYKHSFDKLVNEIISDSKHEIILARANKSMWQILKNCILAILPGGITTYEAAYAGLPTLNIFNNESNRFLIRELEEAGVCLYHGIDSEENLINLNKTIESLYHNRKQLMEMHLNTKGLIKGNSAQKILDAIMKVSKYQRSDS